MKTNTCIHQSITFLSVILLAACSPKTEDVSTHAPATSIDGIQILDTKPTNAIPVKLAKATLKPGDETVIFGQVGGVRQPFLEGYAGFIMGDTDLMFCDEMGDDDHCHTPWDACCEDPDKLKASRAGVNFVDANGKIIPSSMKGFAGIEGLSEVYVKGTVNPASTPDNLIIDATGVFVQ